MYRPSFLARYGFKIFLGVISLALIVLSASMIRAVDAADDLPWMPVYAMFGIWPYLFISVNGVGIVLYAIARRPLGE